MKKFFQLLISAFLFINLLSLNLLSENYNIKGIWLKCIKSVNSFNCNPDYIEDLMKPFVTGAVNSCIIIEIKELNSDYYIKNYLSQEQNTDITYEQNKITYTTISNGANNITYSTDISCIFDSPYTGKCDDNLKIVIPNSATCNSKLSSILYKIDILKDSNNTCKVPEIDQLKTILSMNSKNKWELLGTSIEITNFSIFNSVKSVWAWDGTKWEIYSPDTKLNELIKEFNIPILEKIPANSGFWVNFK